MAGGCGLEAVRGDTDVEGERKWVNNGGRPERDNEMGRRFFVGWLWLEKKELPKGREGLSSVR